MLYEKSLSKPNQNGNRAVFVDNLHKKHLETAYFREFNGKNL